MGDFDCNEYESIAWVDNIYLDDIWNIIFEDNLSKKQT